MCQPDLFIPSQYTCGSLIRADKRLEKSSINQPGLLTDVSENIDATNSLALIFYFYVYNDTVCTGCVVTDRLHFFR